MTNQNKSPETTRSDPKIPPIEDDVCLVCHEPIPQEWATYVKIVDGFVRRAHLTCGDRVNRENQISKSEQ